MKTKILTFCLLTTLLLGCGEAGIESNISKKIEQEFTINQNTERNPLLQFQDALTNVVEINPNDDEFSEYIADLDEYILNSIEMQILSVESTTPFDLTYFGFGSILSPGANLQSEDVWATGNINTNPSDKEEALYEALTNAAGELLAGDPIVLYDARNRNNDVFFWEGTPPQVVANFVQDLLNNQTRYFWAGLWASNYPSEFEIKIKITIDLTARTQLD